MAEVPTLRLKIIDVTKIPSAESGRVGKYDAVVTYQDEAGRVRVVTVPWEELEGKSPDEALEVIARVIRSNESFRKSLIGREVTV